MRNLYIQITSICFTHAHLLDHQTQWKIRAAFHVVQRKIKMQTENVLTSDITQVNASDFIT